jgi:four helix bundle protein
LGNTKPQSEIRSHRDLIVWQRAMGTVTEIYRVTNVFPATEKFGLTSQLRRAAVSIPSNIAEGYGRGTSQDYLRFLRISRGSLFEVDTQLLIATNMGFLSHDQYQQVENQLAETGRVLAGLIKSIESRIANP